MGYFYRCLSDEETETKREGSFKSGHTAGERKNQNRNLPSLSPESLLFFLPLHQTASQTQRGFTVRTKEGTLELAAWLPGDRSPGVSQLLPPAGVNPKVDFIVKLAWLLRLLANALDCLHQPN